MAENLIIAKTVGMPAQSRTARLCQLRHVLTRWDIWVFVGHQTRELMQDVKYEDQQVKWKKQYIKKCHYQFIGTS